MKTPAYSNALLTTVGLCQFTSVYGPCFTVGGNSIGEAEATGYSTYRWPGEEPGFANFDRAEREPAAEEVSVQAYFDTAGDRSYGVALVPRGFPIR